MQERCHETTARRVHVHRHLEAGLGVARDHGVVDRLDRLELARVRRAEDPHDADRAFVDAITASSGAMTYRPSCTGTKRGSTSQYRQNFSHTTCTFEPIIRFGLSVDFPAAVRRARHCHFIASPASMTASLEPIVDAPMVSPSSGAWNRWATMFTQRRSISAVCGYSSLSIMFLSNASAIRRSASGSIQVVTNVARFSREFPSSSSSSWMSR